MIITYVKTRQHNWNIFSTNRRKLLCTQKPTESQPALHLKNKTDIDPNDSRRYMECKQKMEDALNQTRVALGMMSETNKEDD